MKNNTLTKETDALVLTSSAPLPNQMRKVKKLYWLVLGVFLFGIFDSSFLLLGILSLMIILAIDEFCVKINQNKL